MSQFPVLPAALLTARQVHYLEQLDNQQFWSYADELAHAKPAENESTAQQGQEEYLIIESGSDRARGRVILPMSSLRQILPTVPPQAQLPGAPFWLTGLVAWNREAIPVVDLSAYLSQRASRPLQAGYSRSLLIAQKADITIGLAATVIGSLPALSEDQIQPVNSANAEAMQFCIAAISDHGVAGIHAGAPILHLPVILTTMVRQL